MTKVFNPLQTITNDKSDTNKCNPHSTYIVELALVCHALLTRVVEYSKEVTLLFSSLQFHFVFKWFRSLVFLLPL